MYGVPSDLRSFPTRRSSDLAHFLFSQINLIVGVTWVNSGDKSLVKLSEQLLFKLVEIDFCRHGFGHRMDKGIEFFFCLMLGKIKGKPSLLIMAFVRCRAFG